MYSGGMFIFKGILGIIFGLLLIAVPKFTLGAFLALFGILLIAAGVISFLFAVTSRQTDTLFWFMVSGAIVVLGILAFFIPDFFSAVFAVIVAGWALITGVWDLDRYICGHRKFYAIMTGLILVSLAVIAIDLRYFPVLRASYLATICGSFAFVFGVFATILGWMIISGRIPACLLPSEQGR
ncbi:MAG TPA: DUF308 domain-containing protein [Methanoregulaceae archaeon]|nr:DUF308 domain-containing protein [Methanoregulaceae archaeon]